MIKSFAMNQYANSNVPLYNDHNVLQAINSNRKSYIQQSSRLTYNNSIVTGGEINGDHPVLKTDMSINSNKLGRGLTTTAAFKNSSRLPQSTRAKLDFSKKTGSDLKKS